ncbi:hypothetical protein COF01_13405 [Bacillus pseudomycoides]|nr:hypothetical protein CON69_26940 [Bacillus pseudomycoides]PEO42791.1 hypothetical protein CN559_23565 [Bacillus pseudomycoides]PGD71867.1 hypothetical protein COM46_24600 [Bacillus pseudomycoides]PHC37655.1 hypothetical protein COF01_13405 [Bacillus pseudomycoides]
MLTIKHFALRIISQWITWGTFLRGFSSKHKKRAAPHRELTQKDTALVCKMVYEMRSIKALSN